jgi:hypothetical protein
VSLRLRNTGGRGYYRLEYWRARETEGGEHRVVQRALNDAPAQVGLDVAVNNFALS